MAEESDDGAGESDAGAVAGAGDDHPLRFVVSRYARPHAAGFAGGLLALVLARIPERVPALLFGVALDALLIGGVVYDLPLVPTGWIPETTTGQLWFTVGILLAAVLLESALDWIADYAYGRATLQTLHDLRVDANDAVLGLSMSYFDDTQSGDTLSVLNNDVTNVEELAGGAYEGVETATKVFVAFAFMLLLHWQLALAAAILPIVLAATSRTYAQLLEPRYDAVRSSVGTVNSRLEDAIGGVATVKAFTRESAERDRIAASSASYRDAKWSAIKLRLAYDASTWTLAGANGRLLFLLGGYWVLAGPPGPATMPLTAGTLLTFLMYSRSFLFPIRRLAVDVIDRYENAHASAKRVLGVLTDERRIEVPPDAPDLAVDGGAVEYDGVTFTYDGADEPAVEDVDLSVEPGEFVGVVGPTGAGKSTLLKLLFRFYDPDGGAVRVDGQDVSEVSVRSLRESVGYVSQDPFLFYGTVRENVAYARPEASQEAVVAAAKRAGAHGFVEELPEGYDTQVGNRGERLSGGQRQRIALARVFLRDPDLLVLDEATSHVDNETELQIQESLGALAGDRTTFAIAHRLSTVRDADRIVVFEDGRIVESGTHEELLERDGRYADLWRVQVGDVAAVSESFRERAADPEEVVE